MADPRWRTTILNFRSLLFSIAFSRCTSVSLLLVHKKGQQKRSLYQYYWYFTYLSGKIIRNIEKSEYDVTVTSSLGVASQDWVWGFLVWRWSLCVNFTTLVLLVPEIKRGGPRSPPPVTDWPKKPSLNRVKVAGYSFQYFSRLRVCWVIITILYRLTPNSWYQQTAQSSGNKLLLILWHNRLP